MIKRLATIALALSFTVFGSSGAFADDQQLSSEQIKCETEFAALSQTIESTVPTYWIGSEAVPDTICEFEIHVTKVLDAQSNALILASNLDVGLVVSPGLNALEMDGLVAQALIILRESYSRLNVGVTTDFINRTITFSDETAFASNEIERLGELLSDGSTVFKFEQAQRLNDEIRQSLTAGGAVPTTGGSCSSSFIVGNATGYGLATAGHCSGAAFYQGGTYYVITDTLLAKAEGDVRVLLLGDANGPVLVAGASPYFLSNVNTLTAVTAVVNPFIGQSICFYGLSSGRKCSTVYALSSTGNGYQKLAVMNSLISAAGDSGGAVYSYSGSGTSTATAVGLISGQALVNGVVRTQFTRISAVTLLDVHVSTTSTP